VLSLSGCCAATSRVVNVERSNVATKVNDEERIKRRPTEKKEKEFKTMSPSENEQNIIKKNAPSKKAALTYTLFLTKANFSVKKYYFYFSYKPNNELQTAPSMRTRQGRTRF
jgi:hypothetical protein